MRSASFTSVRTLPRCMSEYEETHRKPNDRNTTRCEYRPVNPIHEHVLKLNGTFSVVATRRPATGNWHRLTFVPSGLASARGAKEFFVEERVLADCYKSAYRELTRQFLAAVEREA